MRERKREKGMKREMGLKRRGQDGERISQFYAKVSVPITVTLVRKKVWRVFEGSYAVTRL